MKAKGLLTLLIVATSAFAGCRSTQPDGGATPGRDLVHFSAGHSMGHFTIACRPRTEAISKSPAWIGICNRLGGVALANAARDGLIAKKEGPAFGTSLEIEGYMPADYPFSSKILARDLPLLDTAL